MKISSSIAADFNKKRGIKIITGLDNFNKEQIKQIVQAAEIAKATYVDIAADVNIIQELKSVSKIPLCISAVTAKSLAKCQQAGEINIIEVGNYDCFYEQGRLFSSTEVLEISQEARVLLPNTTLCVTIPHILEIHEQIQLSYDLKNIGVDIIQTEGKSTSFSKAEDLSSLIKKTGPTFSSTYAICNQTNLPIIAASGISSLTSPIAFLYGASCIGIGTSVKRLQNISSMIMYIYEIKTAVECNNSIKNNIKYSIQSSKITRQLVYL